MSILEGALDKSVALCFGVGAMAFGSPGSVADTTVAAAGLIGFLLGQRQKFGPESARIRKSIQKRLLENYSALGSGSDGGGATMADLAAANDALNVALEHCMLDRAKLAASAVTPEGFPDRAVIVVMEGLGQANPDFFGQKQAGTLPYRFAGDVVRAGIQAAIDNADYYRQLEPQLMFEMARGIGQTRDDARATRLTVEEIRDGFRRELDIAQRDLNATETDLVALLAVILQQRVTRENLSAALGQSYERLSQLRDNSGDLRSLGNEIPEIAALLEQADTALAAGKGFSLDDAEKALARADTRYGEIIAERDETLKGDRQNRARILGKRAEIAAVKFDYAGAERLYREQLQLNIETMGPEHTETAECYDNVAFNLDAQGRYGEAEPLSHKALEIRERVLGSDHPDTATSTNNVAYNMNAQGRYDEAEQLYRKALDIFAQVLGPDHAATATSTNNVAGILNAQGQFGEAEPLFRKALDIFERVLGPDHPKTATSINNLAFNLAAQGRYREAEPLYRKALEMRERLLGPTHPDTAVCHNNIGKNLSLNGRVNEAESHYQKSLRALERVLGPNHPTTAIVRKNLQDLLDEKKNPRRGKK
jgi:tetratricopeptide (TPR) repeat protein